MSSDLSGLNETEDDACTREQVLAIVMHAVVGTHHHGEVTPTGAIDPADLGFGALFWLINEAVIVGDADDGRIRLWNPAATRLFGYRAEDAVGMPIADLVPDDLRDRHLAGLERFRTTGTIGITPPGETVELPALHRDGHRIWVSLSLATVPSDRGRFVVACLRDVTDRHEANERLADANAALRQFVAVAAHDLRSPIASLVAALDLLGSSDLPADAERLVAITRRQGHTISQLVADLLDLAQLDAGKMKVDAGEVDVREAAERAAELAGSVGVTLHIAAGAEHVRADPNHIRRILVNLFANAQRYGAPPIAATVIVDGDAVAISVCDGGSGVPPELEGCLFEPFSRASTSTTGTGLGLAISRSLARANGGDLEYQRREGGGTCFTFSLPALGESTTERPAT